MPRKVNKNPKARDDLHAWLLNTGWGPVETEYQFHPERRWKFDYFLPDYNIAVEYEGLMYAGDNVGHASISGILRDVEKYNEATAMGIRVFRAHAKNVHDGSIFLLLEAVKQQNWG